MLSAQPGNSSLPLLALKVMLEPPNLEKNPLLQNNTEIYMFNLWNSEKLSQRHLFFSFVEGISR